MPYAWGTTSYRGFTSRVARIACCDVTHFESVDEVCHVRDEGGDMSIAGFSSRWTSLNSFSVGLIMQDTTSRRVCGSLWVLIGK